MSSSISAHGWTFGGPRRNVDHHVLNDDGATMLQPPPRVPVLLYEARPNAMAGTRTLTDELLRHGFKEWGGIRNVQVVPPAGSLRQAVAPHVDPSGTGGDLPIVLTRGRRQLASAVEQLTLPGTTVAVLSSAVRHQDLVGARNLGLNFLTQIDGLGVEVLRDSRSPFALEHPGRRKTGCSVARTDRLVADLQAACLRNHPTQLILLVDLDELRLLRTTDDREFDAPLVAAALSLVQRLLMQPVVILHSARAASSATEGELGGLAKHLGRCLFRDV